MFDSMLPITRYPNRNNAVYIIDRTIICDKNRSVSERLEKTANHAGRFIIVGRAVGPLRMGYGVVKAALCSVAAFFALVAAGLTSPSKNLREKCFEAAKICANQSLDGLKHIVRGAVETIPLFGSVYLYDYDLKNYSNSKDPTAVKIMRECLISDIQKKDGRNRKAILNQLLDEEAGFTP